MGGGGKGVGRGAHCTPTHQHPHVGMIGLAFDLSLTSLPSEQAQNLKTLSCMVGTKSPLLADGNRPALVLRGPCVFWPAECLLSGGTQGRMDEQTRK